MKPRVFRYSLFLSLFALGGLAEAQPRIGAYLAAGFGGQATADASGFSADADLDPTVGVGLRLELPVGSVVHIGPFAEFDAFKADGQSGRDLGIAAGVLIRAGHRLDLGSVDLELYGAVPVGLSVYFPEGSDETMLGFNVGLLAGAQVHVTERIAIMLELGWQMNRVYEDDASLTSNQAKMHLGAMFLL